jgi:hypothetical protein
MQLVRSGLNPNCLGCLTGPLQRPVGCDVAQFLTWVKHLYTPVTGVGLEWTPQQTGCRWCGVAHVHCCTSAGVGGHQSWCALVVTAVLAMDGAVSCEDLVQDIGQSIRWGLTAWLHAWG